LEFGTVEVEGHAVGQVQLDGVALAINRDAGAGGLATQFGLLPVLVGADRAAGQAAHAGAHQRALAPLGGVASAEQAGHRADAGADEGVVAGAVGVVRRVGLAGVGGATTQHERAGEDGGDDRGPVTHVALLGAGTTRRLGSPPIPAWDPATDGDGRRGRVGRGSRPSRLARLPPTRRPDPPPAAMPPARARPRARPRARRPAPRAGARESPAPACARVAARSSARAGRAWAGAPAPAPSARRTAPRDRTSPPASPG